jgi:hypothetical protein
MIAPFAPLAFSPAQTRQPPSDLAAPARLGKRRQRPETPAPRAFARVLALEIRPQAAAKEAPMALSNAEKQAQWRARGKQCVRALEWRVIELLEENERLVIKLLLAQTRDDRSRASSLRIGRACNCKPGFHARTWVNPWVKTGSIRKL